MTRAHTTYNKLYWVRDNVIANEFPDINSALKEPDGLLAIGGDLTPERLLDAYRRGIFPWYSEGQPILWWTPEPRWILEIGGMKMSRSLRKTLRRRLFRVTFDQVFEDVIKACAEPRKDAEGTWITSDIRRSYKILHEQGYAHSVECWYQNELVGGLYGIAIGKIFFGESMFSNMSDASKVTLVHLMAQLRAWNFRLIDCQIHSRHLESLGAIPISRNTFATILHQFCTSEIRHNWPIESKLT